MTKGRSPYGSRVAFAAFVVLPFLVLQQYGLAWLGRVQQLNNASKQDYPIACVNSGNRTLLTRKEKYILEQEIFCRNRKFFTPDGNSRATVVKVVGVDRTLTMEVYSTRDSVSKKVLKGRIWEAEKTSEIQKTFIQYSKRHSIPLNELTFVDIGANVGWFSFQIASSLGVNVIAIEGMPSNQRLIRTTLCHVSNQAWAEQVTLYATALGNRKQSCFMYSVSRNRGDGHTLCDNDGNKTKELYSSLSNRGEITLERLDDILDATELQIVAVKMDTEGYEGHIVEGGQSFFLRSRIPHIFTEYSPTRLMKSKKGNSTGFVTSLYNAGYRMRNDRSPGKHHSLEYASNARHFPGIKDVIFDLIDD